MKSNKKVLITIVPLIIFYVLYNTCYTINTNYKQTLTFINNNKDEYGFTIGPLPYYTDKYNHEEIVRHYKFIDILDSIKDKEYTKENLPEQNKMSIKLFFFRKNGILDYTALEKFIAYGNSKNIMVGFAAMHNNSIDEELSTYLRFLELSYHNIFMTLQAYHSDVIKRVKIVLRNNGHIRLVKGWYKDGDVTDWKQVTENYYQAARLLVQDKNFHLLATHDFDLLKKLYDEFGTRMDKMEIIFFSFNQKFVENKIKTFPYTIKNKSFYKPYGRKCLSLMYNLHNMDIWRDLQRRFIGKVY